MRVTQNMLISSMVRNLDANRTQIDELQDQISSGKRIRKPSDDPTGAAIALDIRTRQSELEGQERGRGAAGDWLAATETTLNDFGNTLIRVKELGVQASSTLLSPSERISVAAELEQILDHLVQTGNARIGDRFLFAGQRTDTAPFARTPGTTTVAYAGTTTPVQMRVGAGVVMDVSTTGDQLANVFAAVGGMIDDLQAGQPLDSTRLQAAESALDSVLALHSGVGAKTNRLDTMRDRAALDEVNLAGRLSEIEDTDFVETMLKFQSSKTVYEAALSAGAKVIQPSLLDFLR
jgi:flagellar hook-associated protein 3 FlgL